jgi:hypothetical protein
MQLWSDAESGSRVDADAYQVLGVSAVMVVPNSLSRSFAGLSKDGFVYSARAIRGEPILNQEAVRQWRTRTCSTTALYPPAAKAV